MKVEEEWHDRSFFLELKPRSELASLFVDCPPHDYRKKRMATGSSQQRNGTADGKAEEEGKGGAIPTAPGKENGEEEEECESDVVRVGEHWVVLEEGNEEAATFKARIEDLSLSPDSVCSPTWTDNHRLFMCKVHADSTTMPILPKTFSRMAQDLCVADDLIDIVEAAKDHPLSIDCEACNARLLSKKAGECSLGYLPSDDFLETTPAGDFYCRDSCGPACDPYRHSHRGREPIESKSAHAQWVPRADYAVVSHTVSVVHNESFEADTLRIECGIVRCAACSQPLGHTTKNQPHLYTLSNAVITLRSGSQGKGYIETRFGDPVYFFSMLILAQCEAQSSLKLVVRSLDKTPHVLVWLLDSYVVLTTGDLVGEGGPAKAVRPFPALKMLYKVFDASTASRDPRANGEDASVGFADVPLGCCLKIVECLLKSSHALPPACRSIGQFYQGFMRLAAGI